MVVVEGHVQGVGFRYSTATVAARHPVAGFVRNEPDGTVRIEAEGAEQELDRFLADLRNMPVYRLVRREHLEWRPPTGEFERFEIRYM